jgi:uncharacterized coiled-coil protein SlyX
MKFEPKPQDAERSDQVLAENAALRAVVTQRDEEIARLREHLELQAREIAALQADRGTDGKKETAPEPEQQHNGPGNGRHWTGQVKELEQTWAQIKARGKAKWTNC